MLSDALRSEMIIPRSPSPDVANDLLEGLSLDDIRRLASERIVQVNDEVKVCFRSINNIYCGTSADYCVLGGGEDQTRGFGCQARV